MKFEYFLKSNYWKSKVIGKSLPDVVLQLGQPTDEGANKLKDLVKKFGDVEVGFDEGGIAFYCQIDFDVNQSLKGAFEFWPIHGGMELQNVLQLLNSIDLRYTVRTTELNPDFDEIITESGLIFSLAKPDAEFVGKGLVNIRTSV